MRSGIKGIGGIPADKGRTVLALGILAMLALGISIAGVDLLVAEGDGGEPAGGDGAEYVAEVTEGETQERYGVLSEAIEGASPGSTVTLLKDIVPEEIGCLEISKELTIDINGHSVTMAEGKFIEVGPGGKVTIVGEQEGSEVRTESGVLLRAKGSSTADRAELIIRSGTFQATECCVLGLSYSDIVIEGGTFTSTDNGVVMMNGTTDSSKDAYGADANITITGGTFNAGIKSKGYIAMGVYVCNSNGAEITGGTFKVTDGVGIVWRAGNLKVSDDVGFYLSYDALKSMTT